ncbi:hypothetical protein [Corallococcus sp. AS-1-6]|uniref:hypothetical protein n=1 Tax=Corallococcus sp. AS-1-6 TaxID=2874599 RepID=UPI001CBA6F2B|nr:hypothetical protein [Corallococcus sp. AS-1-6]MBZ4371459.1 hypothetical protein [Corallococcus sp. AS-1-6]
MSCIEGRKPCRVPGCDRESRTRGLCVAHEQRERRGKPLDGPIRELKRRQRAHTTQKAESLSDACRLSGCGRPKWRKELCRAHYERQRQDPGNWSGPVREYGTMVYAGDFVAPQEQVQAVVDEAKRRGVSRSFVMREALEEWFQARKAPTAKLPRYAREHDDGLLGPEEPELGMTPDAARARADAIIRREYAEGVPLSALEERFGARAGEVVRDMRRPGTRDERLPFGMPA